MAQYQVFYAYFMENSLQKKEFLNKTIQSSNVEKIFIQTKYHRLRLGF